MADETIFSVSDVKGYQNASKILALTDSRGTKGSFVLDVDKKVLLDLCGTQNLSSGHNHSTLTNFIVQLAVLNHSFVITVNFLM